MYNLFSKLAPPATKLHPFDFTSETHFVASTDGTTVKVYELTDPTVHPSSIQRAHFRELAEIHHDGLGLLFSDGRGRIEGREALTALAIHLAQSRLLATPDGHCLQDVTGLQMYANFNIHYLRLNDLFPWSNHGVGPKTAPTPTPTNSTWWGRFELKRPEGNAMTQYTTVRKDKHEMTNKEVQKLRRENEEQQKALKKKEDEAKKLMQDRDEARHKQSTEEPAGLVNKYAEQQRLLKKKENEVKKLQKELLDERSKFKQLVESMQRQAGPMLPRTLTNYIPTMNTAKQVGNTINNTASYIHSTAKYLADTATATTTRTGRQMPQSGKKRGP